MLVCLIFIVLSIVGCVPALLCVSRLGSYVFILNDRTYDIINILLLTVDAFTSVSIVVIIIFASFILIF